ncbi:hypothetical protein [Phycobacter azelaicus]|uniref:hypothetical protein n=1 Tax=Phycobacter azelaicus TaxID=2668075 RepID=UPI00186909C4|nr:hypothetical protein [Phycobacter azelaicus]MBE1296488.1 hypothetical protein [Paracoccaceae bacterium]
MLVVSVFSGWPDMRQVGWIGLYLIYLLAFVNLSFFVGNKISAPTVLFLGKCPDFGELFWVRAQSSAGLKAVV